MQKTLFIKLATIVLISVFLLIPINLISDKIYERAGFREEAIRTVAESWTESQSLLGPFLVMPYTQTLTESVWDKVTESYLEKKRTTKHLSFIAPADLTVNADIDDEIRTRGIYDVPVYTADMDIAGEYSGDHIQQQLDEVLNLKGEIILGKPWLVFGVTDPRGINRVPSLNWQKNSLEFLPGTQLSQIPQGVHVPLPELQREKSHNIAFDFTIRLRGIESLSVVPTGQNMSIDFKSKWQHPKFVGQFLPTAYQVSEEGYDASWQVTSFATNINENLKKCAKRDCEQLFDTHFGVEHIQAVDVYLQSERSVKYGLLFITLTFLTFFLIEIKNKMAIHPIQYILVGAAISIFYLLLFALSEHLSFLIAYGIASLSCVVVIGSYVSKVLGGSHRAGIFAGALWLLYGILYIIVSAEDYALLMGAVLTFALLATLMLVTRNVDWFGVMNELEVVKKDASLPKKA